MSIFWAVIIGILCLFIGVLIGIYLNDFYERRKPTDGWLFVDKTPGCPTEIYATLERHPNDYKHRERITLEVSVEENLGSGSSQQKQGS